MGETNQEIVLKLYGAFAQGDFQYVSERIAPQFTASQTTELPWGGIYHGFTEYLTFVKKLRDYIESNPTIEETFEAGDHVVMIVRTVGHVIKTGIPFNVRAVYLWTLKEGCVTQFEAYLDTPAMLHALQQTN